MSDSGSGAARDVPPFGPWPVAVSVSASASVAASVAAPVAASASSAADAPHVRTVLRVPHAQAGTLARALAATKAIRSARKDPEPLHVRMGWTGEGSR